MPRGSQEPAMNAAALAFRFRFVSSSSSTCLAFCHRGTIFAAAATVRFGSQPRRSWPQRLDWLGSSNLDRDASRPGLSRAGGHPSSMGDRVPRFRRDERRRNARRPVVAAGPFRYVRNPLYLGAWLLATGVSILMPPSGAAFFLPAFSIFVPILISAEERFLSAKLGDHLPAVLPPRSPSIASFRPADASSSGASPLAASSSRRDLSGRLYAVLRDLRLALQCAHPDPVPAGLLRPFAGHARVYETTRSLRTQVHSEAPLCSCIREAISTGSSMRMEPRWFPSLAEKSIAKGRIRGLRSTLAKADGRCEIQYRGRGAPALRVLFPTPWTCVDGGPCGHGLAT